MNLTLPNSHQLGKLKFKHEINASSSAGTMKLTPLEAPKSLPSYLPNTFPYIETIDIDGGSIHGISTNTLKRLMQIHNQTKIVILDCRYSYEYKGGHITGAINIKNAEDLDKIYHRNYPQNTIFVFHCEFSKNRGKAMLRKFKELDRSYSLMTTYSYKYENVYLLVGGYKQFYMQFPNLCVGSYTEMRDDRYVMNNTHDKCEQEFWKDFISSSSSDVLMNETQSNHEKILAFCDSMDKLELLFDEADPFFSSIE